MARTLERFGAQRPADPTAAGVRRTGQTTYRPASARKLDFVLGRRVWLTLVVLFSGSCSSSCGSGGLRAWLFGAAVFFDGHQLAQRPSQTIDRSDPPAAPRWRRRLAAGISALTVLAITAVVSPHDRESPAAGAARSELRRCYLHSEDFERGSRHELSLVLTWSADGGVSVSLSTETELSEELLECGESELWSAEWPGLSAGARVTVTLRLVGD